MVSFKDWLILCLFRALVVGLSKYINPPLYKPPFHKVTLHLPALDLAILGILYITIQCFSIDECLTFNRTSKFILFYCNTVLVTQVWNTNTAKLPSFLYCKCLPYTSNPQTLEPLDMYVAFIWEESIVILKRAGSFFCVHKRALVSEPVWSKPFPCVQPFPYLPP